MEKIALQAHVAAYLLKYKGDEHAQKTLDFLEKTTDFWQSTTETGHITASAWILNRTRTRALLTHHLKLNAWFQLGGHVETEDTDIFAAALREAQEESGLRHFTMPQTTIFDIDVHRIPLSKKGFPAHFHYDIRILLLADDAENIAFDVTESNTVQWFDLDKIKAVNDNESVQRMVRKTADLL
jgi:8-oxo-dGTP pyrophosphatase MutT (NUDIX family)